MQVPVFIGINVVPCIRQVSGVFEVVVTASPESEVNVLTSRELVIATVAAANGVII